MSASIATSWVASSVPVAPEPREGTLAVAPRLVESAQVMVGHRQQEVVEGGRVGPCGGPGQHRGGRRPVAKKGIGCAEPRQAVSSGVGLDRP